MKRSKVAPPGRWPLGGWKDGLPLAAAFLFATALAVDASTPSQAGDKEWRIIYNNDGGDALTLGGSNMPRVENITDASHELVRRRTDGLQDFKITTVSYCTGMCFGQVLHRSKVAEQFRPLDLDKAANKDPKTFRDSLIEMLDLQGTDSLRIMSDYCRKNGLELWWSMRMNDTHDASYPDKIPLSAFKKKHPELLLGKEGEKLAVGMWSGVDYAHPEVREFALAMIEEVLANYTVQGIELDFFRHPVLFSSVARGGVASDADRAALTSFMERARKLIAEHNSKLPPDGKKVLFGARVPDSADYCKQIGIDLEGYLKNQLLDFCLFGGYFRLAPWSESADLAQKYHVPSYASIDRVAVQIPKNPVTAEPDHQLRYGWIVGTQDTQRSAFFRRSDLEAYRGRILSAVAQGHHGIAFFNLFNKDHPIFPELGDLEAMASRPAKYFYMARGTQQSPSQSLTHGNTFFSGPVINPGYPKALSEKGVEVQLVTRLPANGFTGVAELLVDFTGSGATAGKADIEVNGQSVTPSSIMASGEIILKVPPALVRNGANLISICPVAPNRNLLVRDIMLRLDPQSPSPSLSAVVP